MDAIRGCERTEVTSGPGSRETVQTVVVRAGGESGGWDLGSKEGAPADTSSFFIF